MKVNTYIYAIPPHNSAHINSLLTAPITKPITPMTSLDHIPDFASRPKLRYQSRVQRQRVVVKLQHADVAYFDHAQISNIQSRVEER